MKKLKPHEVFIVGEPNFICVRIADRLSEAEDWHGCGKTCNVCAGTKKLTGVSFYNRKLAQDYADLKNEGIAEDSDQRFTVLDLNKFFASTKIKSVPYKFLSRFKDKILFAYSRHSKSFSFAVRSFLFCYLVYVASRAAVHAYERWSISSCP